MKFLYVNHISSREYFQNILCYSYNTVFIVNINREFMYSYLEFNDLEKLETISQDEYDWQIE